MKKEKKTPETVEEETVETAEQKLQKELDEKNEQFLRLCAEYDNFRKRSQKEKQDIYTSSRAEIVKDLLPVLDNFDRAAENKECSFEDYKKGIDLIFTQLGEILKKLGIEAYGARGDEFDPNIHNAVMTVEDPELGENQVASVFSKGYKLGDRIIREAVVQVANS
ncbi:MAG: nucleotide exchange factor GrpE [Ruminococcaceae bacterium]|nr:nucleotide exchange factor GrpE [Oscillospiraceae bacterium]